MVKWKETVLLFEQLYSSSGSGPIDGLKSIIEWAAEFVVKPNVMINKYSLLVIFRS